MGLFDGVADFFKRVWANIKNFFRNVFLTLAGVINWFKDPNRLRKIQQNNDIIAVQIKDALATGSVSNYSAGLRPKTNAINCLYNKATGEVVDYNTSVQGYEDSTISDDLERAYAGKRMVIFD